MAEKETQFLKIKRISSDQKHIRNIATSAHIHHGKCISEDSRLVLTDGSIKTARELFESVSKNGEVYKENEDHTIFIPNERVEIFSLNKATGQIEKKPIQYVWRLVGGKTIKTRLRNGFEIETTPEHRYTVFRNGFKDIEARDLKIGDRVICARKLSFGIENKEIKKDILERLSQKNFYVKLNSIFSKELNKKILNYGIKNLRLTIKPKSFYHGLWQNRYNLKDLVEICELFSINLGELYNKIDIIFFRTGKQRGGNSNPIKLPQDFEDFFYMAGLFIGDGSKQKFIVGKKSLGLRMKEICGDLGFSPKEVNSKNRTPEIHTNLTLVEIFNSLFDYPLKKKSHNIRISDFVRESEDRLISKLIRGH